MINSAGPQADVDSLGGDEMTRGLVVAGPRPSQGNQPKLTTLTLRTYHGIARRAGFWVGVSGG